ncbi:UNVERIFIED_ORG: hypothetical protein ABRZ91_000867 [Heyndrickxia coagulans]
MKKLFFILLMLLMIGMISGCSLITKEVDYQKIADDLNKKKMSRVLYPKKGYAEFEQRTITSVRLKINNKIREKSKTIEIKGIYNTKNNTAVGKGQQSYEIIDNPDTSKSKQIEDKKGPEFRLNYSNNHYYNLTNKKSLNFHFVFDKLQGIEKLKPDHYTYGLDEPPSVNYKLNEKEFNRVINDDLKIKYDKFKNANIFISLHEDNNKLYIDYIEVGAEWENHTNYKKEDFVLDEVIYTNKSL